ncbi:MAG: hypothetical protein M1817_005893 [Caeruleum heppii]|nr:MAG: hypothetical protein M1817_005893 [Caeruleum heppii]
MAAHARLLGCINGMQQEQKDVAQQLHAIALSICRVEKDIGLWEKSSVNGPKTAEIEFHVEQAFENGHLKPLSELEDLFHVTCGKLRMLISDLETRLANSFFNRHGELQSYVNGRSVVTPLAASEMLANLQMRYDVLFGDQIYPLLENAIKNKKAQEIIHLRVIERGVDPADRQAYLRACAQDSRNVKASQMRGMDDYRQAPVSVLFTMLAERQHLKELRAEADKRRQDIAGALACLEANLRENGKGVGSVRTEDEEHKAEINVSYETTTNKEDELMDDATWGDACSISGLEHGSLTMSDNEDEEFAEDPISPDDPEGNDQDGASLYSSSIEEPALRHGMASLGINDNASPSVDRFFTIASDCESSASSVIGSEDVGHTTDHLSSAIQEMIDYQMSQRNADQPMLDQATNEQSVHGVSSTDIQQIRPNQVVKPAAPVDVEAETAMPSVSFVGDSGPFFPYARMQWPPSPPESPQRSLNGSLWNSSTGKGRQQDGEHCASNAPFKTGENMSVLYYPSSFPWTEMQPHPATGHASDDQQSKSSYPAKVTISNIPMIPGGCLNSGRTLGSCSTRSSQVEPRRETIEDWLAEYRREHPSTKEKLRKIWKHKLRRGPYSPTLDD